MENPTPWSAEFGEMPDPPMFTEQPGEPGARSSARRITDRRQADEQAARQARDLAHLQAAADQETDDHALATAIRMIRAGKTPGPKVRVRATRALERHGGGVLTSAELLAGRRG